jgi:hypothetical protein
VVHGQLDQEGDDHPAASAEIGKQLLEGKEDLHRVVVLEVLEDERLNGFANVLFGHLWDQLLQVRFRVLEIMNCETIKYCVRRNL